MQGPVNGHRTQGPSQVRKVRKFIFRSVQTWPCPLVLGLSAGHARGQVRRVRTNICRTFRTWPVASPMEGAHNQRTKPGPKGPTNNLSDLSDLAPCRPREEAQGLRTRLGPKGLENCFLGHFGPGLVLGLCIGLARGQFRKVRQVIFRIFRTWLVAGPVKRRMTRGRGHVRTVRQVTFSEFSDSAPWRPREGAQNQRTRPSPKGPKLTLLTFRT